jgi:hypothetical protein
VPMADGEDGPYLTGGCGAEAAGWTLLAEPWTAAANLLKQC